MTPDALRPDTLRPLGDSGFLVSPICLGAMMFGGASDEGVAADIVASARDAGVNFVDTADVYNGGESERVVGRLIALDRNRWVLATKAGNHIGPGPMDGGLRRKWLLRAIEASLMRLDTDYVDVWYLHLDDEATPLEETVAAVGDVISSGQALHWGVSNYRGWRIAEAVRIADTLGVARPIVCQPYYNAFNRAPEIEVLPACEHYGLGVVPYSPLARGVLTGKYDPDAPPPADTRAGRQDVRMMETEFRPDSLRLAQEVKARAEAQGMAAGHLALNWVLNNRLVSSVLAGPRTLAQWRDYLAALAQPFTADDEAFFEALVPTGQYSSPGFADPRYPYRGRVPAPA